MIYVYQKGAGYVGLGRVLGDAVMARDLEVNGKPLLTYDLAEPGLGHDRHDPDMAEYVVPVEWLRTYDVAEAKSFPKMFASQHVVCKLSDPATLNFLANAFV